MKDKKKELGQVFTPKKLVEDMLNFVDYTGSKILKKHIIDNSCGDGAFLIEIVKKYIDEHQKLHNSLTKIKKELETYIHGIELDADTYIACLNNLDKTALLYGITNVKWNIICGNTLNHSEFDKKMDYVIGNPPYVRVHNLGDNFNKIRNYTFCKKGMTDLYILFYEIGLNMLNKNGVLCYITPNSFYSSLAGENFRKYISKNKNLSLIADLGHYQPFKVTTYTTICIFHNNKTFKSFDYYKYNQDGTFIFKDKLEFNESIQNNKIILTTKKDLELYKQIQSYTPINKNLINVKNGFATLADNIFISDKKYPNSIKVIKASTGQWFYSIFPYDNNLDLIDFDNLSKKTKEHLSNNKATLEKRCLDKNAKWYSFGRSQAIKDVYKDKIAINTTIKDKKSIKLNKAGIGEGIYSGLYILGNISFERIKQIIVNDDFIHYLTILGKCKNGGYYTFSSIDLKKYLIYTLETTNE